MSLHNEFGWVCWFCGMSGSGKTTIANHFLRLAIKLSSNTIILDGDAIREMLDLEDKERDYTIEARAAVTNKIQAIANFLIRQNINVVVCNITAQNKLLEENRKMFLKYFEVFIDADIKQLIKLDSKDIYKKALNGQLFDVVGVDIPYQKPLSPDIIIKNGLKLKDPELIASDIWGAFKKSIL